jgi:hypothetical protein
MEVKNLRPPFRPQDLAEFDLQIGPHLRIFSLAIRRPPDGRYRILAPNAAGKHSASFHPALCANIVDAVLAAMGGSTANDDDHRSAA